MSTTIYSSFCMSSYRIRRYGFFFSARSAQRTRFCGAKRCKNRGKFGAERRLLKIVGPPKAAQRRKAPLLENCWAAEGGAKRRLLKIVEPPKAAQWREVPPFENGLAANGGVAARSAVFIKWFVRLFKITLSPFENCLSRPPFGNGSLCRLLTVIRTPFTNASLKMSTTFYKLYCRLFKIGLPPFQKWFFDNGSSNF